LSPENIDTYADDALADLIKLIESILAEYQGQFKGHFSKKGLEDLTLTKYRITGINETLDYISEKSEEIKDLGKFIDETLKLDSVIVPPQTTETTIIPGSGTFKEKLTIPRTKAILFILANDFDIDIHDPEQLSLTIGALKDNMMRKESYTMIEVPKLERLILCCDEEGNVTYVFDRAKLKENDISGKDLTDLTKSDLDDLINDEPQIGKRAKYTNRFIPNILKLINEIPLDITAAKQESEEEAEKEGLYLYKKAPKDFSNIEGLARRLGVAHRTIDRQVEKLKNKLGPIIKHRYGFTPRTSLSPQQQAAITQELHDEGKLYNLPPKGYSSIRELADKLGISNRTIYSQWDNLARLLGNLEYHRYLTQGGISLSPRQQAIITQELHHQGLLVDRAPKGFMSITAFSKKLGVGVDTVKNEFNEMGYSNERLESHRYGSNPHPSLSPKMQSNITQNLHEKGKLTGPAPLGYMSRRQLMKKLDVSYSVIQDAIKELGLSGDEIDQHRHGQRYVPSLSPQQQADITQNLHDKGRLVDRAPKGFIPISSLASELGKGKDTIKDAIKELGGDLNELRNYRFHTYITIGLSPEQQKIIKGYLLKKEQ
jgi:biotin operon repressor